MSVIYRNSGAFNELDGIAIRISNLLYYGNFRESFAYYASENICNGDTNGKYIFGRRNLMILVLLYGVEGLGNSISKFTWNEFETSPKPTNTIHAPTA